MGVNTELLKGSSITVILTVLSRGEFYGYELIKEIERESKGAFTFKEGTLYPVLHTLENDGSIQSRWEETESARKRKFYKITSKGRKVLAEKTKEWVAFRSALDGLISNRVVAEV
jgi:PadR family transcriptional regulator PadR